VSLCSLRVFLGVVFALPTAADYVLALPVRWPDLPYCLDDRALRWHIHPIPPQYKALRVPTGSSNRVVHGLTRDSNKPTVYRGCTFVYAGLILELACH
jgi:hypothetical protein